MPSPMSLPFGALVARAGGHAAGWLSAHQGEAEAALARRAYAAHGVQVRAAHLDAVSVPRALRVFYDLWAMADGLDEAPAAEALGGA